MRKGITVISVLHLDPRKFGSMEEYTLFLARAMRDRGWHCVLVFSKAMKEPILSQFNGSGAILEVFRNETTAGAYTDIMRIQRTHGGDIIHFHFFNQFTVLPILGRLAGARSILFTDHIRRPQQLRSLTRIECRVWDRIVLPLVGARVLAVSEHIKRTLADCYEMKPQRIQVVPNGVNLARFAPPAFGEVSSLREELNISLETPIVLCASNLRPEKGVGDLLTAAKVVLQDNLEVHF